MSFVIKRLRELNISLPEKNLVAGNYVSYILRGDLLSISGQTCKENGRLVYAGKVGSDISVDDGVLAARICGLNVLSQVEDACGGDWDRIKGCIKLGVFINGADGFLEYPRVANGASDIIVDVLGERGIHTRSAVGASGLPGGSSVEVDAFFHIRN
jgi:enamine deaminase RidA (YjgF/YER057c/UK114 family)